MYGDYEYANKFGGKIQERLVNKKILRIKERRAYRDGIKRKGDKIGMVSVVSSKMRMVSEEL